MFEGPQQELAHPLGGMDLSGEGTAPTPAKETK